MTASSARGRAWRTLRARVLAEEHVCGICGREVDKALPKGHPGAPHVDHIRTVRQAPELVMVRSNLRLTHATCNQKRRTGRHRPVPPEPPPAPVSRSVYGPLSQGWQR